MEAAKSIPEETAERVTEKRSSPVNTVMIVQTVVCIIAVLFVFLIGRLSPQTFDFIKDEYNRIMSIDMGADEMAASAKSVIDKASIPSQKSEEEVTKSPKKESTDQAKNESDGRTLAVMSLFKSNEEITVPVHGEITSEYGNRINPVSGEYLMHSGVDIAADSGTAIRAAYSGVVSEVGSNSIGGNYISLVHKDGSETLYCHCSKIIAKKGDVIRAGETIALVGSTGRSTGPHLHFEMHIGDKTVDPLIYLPVKNGAI